MSDTNIIPDRTLDVTRDVCPMTFVRTRLMLDRMQAGSILEILLRGSEARRNVPLSAQEHGHVIVQQEERPDGITRLLIRKQS